MSRPTDTPQIPAVGRMRPIKIPAMADEKLRNGLRVIALRRPSVPRVEVRVRIPAGLAHDTGNAARARLLPETLLGGTATHDSVSLARELQRLGASMEAHVDPDDLSISGGTLSHNLSGFLDLLAEIITTPTFPAHEVAVARDRVAQEIVIQRSQPQAVASEAMTRRLFGKHPYGRGLPEPDAVRRIGSRAIATYHAASLLPRGSSIVLVGDCNPARAIEQVAAALSSWRARGSAADVPAPAAINGADRIDIINRPGAVQTNIRIGGPGLPRSHPDYFKLSLANMVFGGYFTSRLVSNIREAKGYTYGGGSVVAQRRAAATLSIGADVRSDVTAAALNEIRYELGRMVSLPVEQSELDAARRYLSGVMSLQIQTQAGMASMIDSLVAGGLGLDYLKEYRARLESVTVEDVLAASRAYLDPRRMVTVLVGDAEQVATQAGALDEVAVTDR